MSSVLVGSQIVGILEDCWATIQAHHPSVPDVTISLAFVKRNLGFSYGRHVIITFDALKAGPGTVVAVLLHEAVHQSLRVSGARDWGAHRGTFRRLALEFGLADDAHPRFGSVDLTNPTADHYRAFLDDLGDALEAA